MTRAQSAVWAVVPVKGFARGKSRLGSVLSDDARIAFARGLFEHVIATLQGEQSIAAVAIVTEDDDVARTAHARGLAVVRDPPACSLATSVDAGLAYVAAQGASAAFVCMADLPLLTGRDVAAVVGQLADHDVVLAPDLAGAGTNVLCLAPADGLPSCFGRQDSFARHLTRARDAGLRVQVLERRGLCFDVDDPADLEEITSLPV